MAIFQDKNSKTKDGRSWYFSTYYVDLYGNRKKYKSKRYLTKKEAQEAERNYLLISTNKINVNNITFRDLIASFDDFKKDKIKITSYSNYKKFYKNLYSLNNVKVEEFSITHFNKWKTEINEKKYSTRYKNNNYKFLRTLLNYAVKYYNMNLNSILLKMTNFTNPNELKQEMLFFTYEEFNKFISEENNFKYKVFFEVLYFCGLRKGEANALTWKDIDFGKKTMDINKNISQKITGEKYVMLPTKTKTSNRILPLSKKVYNELMSLYNEYKKYENFNSEWFVFGGILPLADSSIQTHKDSNCKKAKVKTIRTHDFRHSCASLLINNGASLTLVSKYLGHSNITTTLNTYTHMFKNEYEDIIKTMDNL